VSQLGIVDANRLTVDQAVAPMPTMRSTIMGWFRPITLVVIRKQTVDFETKETEVALETRGTVQPFSATQLAIKPEGERAWKWKMIHATPDLVLSAGEVINYRGTKLRIMRQFPYDENGFVQYEAIEDYGNR
jgi:hypothetical protein